MIDFPPVRRMVGETWRDAVSRVGDYFGKAWEALRLFDAFLNKGNTEEAAAAMVRHEYNTMQNVLL